jgi:hypothetical protein
MSPIIPLSLVVVVSLMMLTWVFASSISREFF